MILAHHEIRRAIADGEVVFSPEINEEQQIGPTNVDLRLGSVFTVFEEVKGVTFSIAGGIKALEGSLPWNEQELPEFDEFHNRRSFRLAPGQFVLAKTLESVKIPSNLIALVEGRSSYARMGLSMHQTAPWIHPG